jgi:hypothetical protein
MRKPTSIIRRIDPDGRECVGISLSNAPGRHAWLYLTDYLYLVEAHGFSAFYLNEAKPGYAYVRAHPRFPQAPLYVAKVVAGVRAKGSILTFADGDRCNLRRSNLVLTRRRSKQRKHHSRSTLNKLKA